MKTIYMLAVLLLCLMQTAEARPARTTQTETTVTGVGEAAHLKSDGDDDAFKRAEQAALADASTKIGTYMEVLNVTNSATGQSDQVVASIAASILSYEVTSHTTTEVGNERVTRVEVLAKVNEQDVRSAMQRYLQSASYREALRDLEKQNEALLDSMQAQRVIIDALASTNSSLSLASEEARSELSARIEYLQKRLSDETTHLGDVAKLFMETRASVPKDISEVNQSRLSAIAEKDRFLLEQHEAEYYSALNKVMNDYMKTSIRPRVQVNAHTGKTEVVIHGFWYIQKEGVEMLLSPSEHTTSSDKPPGSDREPDFTSQRLTGEAYDRVRLKYAVDLVVTVNGKEIIRPVLAPATSPRETLTPYCEYFSPYKPGARNAALCIAETGSFEFEKDNLIFTSSKERGIPPVFEVNSGEDLTVTTELRVIELGTNKILSRNEAH